MVGWRTTGLGELPSRTLNERVDRLLMPIALIGLLIGMLAAHVARAYNSDDAAPLVVLSQWLQGHHHVAYFGSDTYIMKFPLYLVVQELLPHSRTAMLLIILVVNLVALWLFITSARYFLRKFKAYDPKMFLVSLAWLVALGSPFLVLLMNPHARNIEIGLAFYLVMLLDRSLAGPQGAPTAGRWAKIGGGAALAGLLMYDDPYFLITVAVPAGLVLAWQLWLRPRDQRVWQALGALAATYIVFKVFMVLGSHLGIVASTGEARFIEIDQLAPMLGHLLDNTLLLFRANFFGLAFYSKSVLAVLPALAVLGLIVWQLRAQGRFRDSRQQPGLLMLVLIAVVVPAAFVLSSFSSADATRYLILLPFLGVIFINLAYAQLGSDKLRAVLLVLVLWSAVANGIILLRDGYRAVRTQHPNSSDRTVIDAARTVGVSKGYAQYWSANIATYLGSDNPTVVGVQCSGATTRPYYWLMDSGELDVPARQSFYLLQTDPAMQGCSLEDVVSQFGRPERTVQVDDGDQMLIYPYDLKERMPL